MSPRVRCIVFVAGALGFGTLLLGGLAGLPRFGVYRGPYGDVINARVVPERHMTNAVTAVTFDYRGFDTLGEEFILFAAVAGVALLLRELRGRSPEGEPERVRLWRSEAVRWTGLVLIVLTDLFGLYLVAHAQLTPGGGFQGGAILGTGSLLVYLTAGYKVYRQVVTKPMLDLAEGIGAGAYALIGLGALVVGGAFLQNVLPLGKTGDIVSAGTVPLINLGVGLEVAGGFALLFVEFLEETRRPVPGEDQ